MNNTLIQNPTGGGGPSTTNPSPPINKMDNHCAASSVGSLDSSMSMRAKRVNSNSKHFTENTRLQEAIRVYTTLQVNAQGEADDAISVGDGKIYSDNSSFLGDIAGIPNEVLSQAQTAILQTNSFTAKSSSSAFHDPHNNTRNFIQRIQNHARLRLFKANHVLLQHQAVTSFAYHLILLFEFLQILFYVFNRVEIINEFQKPQTQSLSDTANSTLLNPAALSDSYLGDDTQQIFTIENNFKFMNFPFFILEGHSKNEFLIMMITMNGTFILFVALLYFSAETLFNSAKTGNLKDGSKVGVQILSFIMVAYLTVLQIPMVAVNLEGYLCDENPDDIYIIDIECGSVQHNLSIAIATVCLPIYLVFLFIQRLLFTSRTFDTDIPWGSLERRLELLKIIFKLVLSLSFMFDKQGTVVGYIDILCFLLCGAILYNRINRAIIFKPSVYTATILYESLLVWLFICIGGERLSGSQLNISSLILIIALSILTSLLKIILAGIVNERSAGTMNSSSHELEMTPVVFERYIYLLYSHIQNEENNEISRQMLSGVIFRHLETCYNKNCSCLITAAKLNGIKLPRNVIKNDSNYQALISAKSKFFQRVGHIASSSKVTKVLSQSFNLKKEQTLTHQNTIGSAIEEAKHELNIDNLNVKSIPKLLSPSKMLNSARKPLSTNSILKKESQKDASMDILSYESLSNSPSGMITFNKVESNSSKFKKICFEDQTQEPFTNDKVDPLNQSIGKPNQIVSQNENAVQKEETLSDDFDFELYQKSKQTNSQKCYYQFLAILIKDEIAQFPKSVDLKILNAFIQRMKLKNEFKAIFELMNCEFGCEPSLVEKFTIFTRKYEIEKLLQMASERNGNQVGNVDVKTAYNYEKLFQKYSLLEYVTANSALSFWREMLQKDINAKAMQARGIEISKNYAKIQLIANALQKINPNEIKFLHRYGFFLKTLMNNDYDALGLFEKACSIYQTNIQRKSNDQSSSEKTIYGENTAVSIIIISASCFEVGKIIHVNEEINQLLGFSSKELLGKKIDLIMPAQIGRVHDTLINKYFETNKSTVVNQVRHRFAVTKDGYMRHLQILVKVYPQLTDKLLLIGFLQESPKFNEMQLPKQDFEARDSQYLMTDVNLNITCVTEGLNDEVGLNTKFFTSSKNNFQYQINLKLICPDITDPDLQDQIESDGQLLSFDTRQILDMVELEQLTAEEILEIKSKLGVFQAYVQMKKPDYEQKAFQVFIFRIIIVQQEFCLSSNSLNFQIGTFNTPALLGQPSLISQRNNKNKVRNPNGIDEVNLIVEASMDLECEGELELGSASTSSGSSTSFNKIIQDFKKVLSERVTPRNLVYLNRIIIFIFLVTFALSGLEYYFQQQYLTDVNLWSEFTIKKEERMIQSIQLASNIRSLVNIASELEMNFYEGKQLQKINRFTYLSRLIQAQAENLKDVHDYITQELSGNSAELDKTGIEHEKVSLYRLDQNNRVYKYELQYKIALNSYLNFVQLLNGTTVEDLKMPFQLLQVSPLPNISYVDTNSFNKNIAFLLLNGLREIREHSQETIMSSSTEGSIFSNIKSLVLLVLSISVSTTSIILILSRVIATEGNKGDILSMFTQLRMSEVKIIYETCDQYIDILSEIDSVFKEEEPKPQPQKAVSRLISNSQLNDYDSKSIRILMKKQQQDAAGNRQNDGLSYERDSEISEEEKDEIQNHYFLMKMRMARQQINRSHTEQHIVKNHTLGADHYGNIIKHTVQLMREIHNRESQVQARQEQMAKKNSQNLNIEKHYKHRRAISIHPAATNTERDQSNDALDDSTERELIEDRLTEVQRQRKQHTHQKRIEKREPQDNSRDILREEITGRTQDDINKAQNVEALDIEKEEIAQRQRQFQLEVRKKNWKFLFFNIFFGLFFASYCLFSFFYNGQGISNFKLIDKSTPTLLERYEQMMLAYAFLRERIIFNNSLESFTSFSSSYFTPSDADAFYKEQFMSNENKISSLKLESSSSLKQSVDFLKIIDSEKLCASVIGQFRGNKVEKVTVTKNMEKKLKEIKKRAYQYQLNTVIAACNAASAGDLATLKRLHAEGVDLNIGDYDRRTPLHVSTGAGHIHIVKYLIEEVGVIVSPVDRWGATPLCDAQPHPEIKALLLSHGAILGKLQPNYVPFQVEVTDDQFRLYYAAYFGDVAMMDNLRLLGWNVNGQDYDGRTAIGVAASEGQLEVVKYLVAKGADLSIKDGRGNDALADAIRQNRTATIEYLSSIIYESLIRDYCSDYEAGLLNKGIQQAFGIFHKKMADLQIAINQTSNATELLEKLQQKGNSSGNSATIPMFIETQELYLHTVIDKTVDALRRTYATQLNEYDLATKITFFAYLCIQLLIMFYLRPKLVKIMKEEVFQSRGILNLIPETFFEENQDSVEKLIKKLKD